jgi:hypothetical protein
LARAQVCAWYNQLVENSLLRYLIIPHPAATSLLCVPSDSGWTLPCVDLPGHFYTNAGAINQAVAAQLSLKTTILRMLYRHQAPPNQPAARVYAAENHSPDWAPPQGSRWVSQAELPDLQLVVAEHRAVLEAWFADAPPPTRLPWAQPGWYAEACAWIGRELDRLGLAATGPVEQLKVWSISCLLKVPVTPGGAVYFKACPPLLPSETGITAFLTREFPAHAPELLAADSERRWLLTAEFTGPTLETVQDEALWAQALAAYARMQVNLIPHTVRLLEAGCPDRSLRGIAAELDGLLADTELLEGEGRLHSQELAQLRAMAPELQQLLAEAERLGPPPTLEHGDLHPGNMALDGERILIFDWSDACVSHPFFSLVNCLDFLKSASGESGARLRLAYLTPWAEHFPMEQLQAALHAAERLHPLYLATFIRCYVLPNVEMKAEWLWLPAYFLRRLLPKTPFCP